MVFETSENPGREWDLFARKRTDVLFYHSVWSDVLKDGLGGRPYYLSMKDESGIVCGMPGVMLTCWGIRLFYSSIPYGGYLGDPEHFDGFMVRFMEEATRADIAYVSPYCPEWDNGYTMFSSATAEAVTRIDLKGRTQAEVFSRFEPSVRQSLNKAAREGIDVSKCLDEESFLIAHRLYLQTMGRNRALARYPEKWFSALHRFLAGKGLASVYLARHNGIPVSATVVINSGNGRHLLHSGSGTEHLRLRANDVIVCEIVRDAIRDGNEYLDFMLSDPLDTKLISWKEKFGGSTGMLHKYAMINSPLKLALWNGAKRIYPHFQRLRQGIAGQP